MDRLRSADIYKWVAMQTALAVAVLGFPGIVKAQDAGPYKPTYDTSTFIPVMRDKNTAVVLLSAAMGNFSKWPVGEQILHSLHNPDGTGTLADRPDAAAILGNLTSGTMEGPCHIDSSGQIIFEKPKEACFYEANLNIPAQAKPETKTTPAPKKEENGWVKFLKSYGALSSLLAMEVAGAIWHFITNSATLRWISPGLLENVYGFSRDQAEAYASEADKRGLNSQIRNALMWGIPSFLKAFLLDLPSGVVEILSGSHAGKHPNGVLAKFVNPLGVSGATAEHFMQTEVEQDMFEALGLGNHPRRHDIVVEIRRQMANLEPGMPLVKNDKGLTELATGFANKLTRDYKLNPELASDLSMMATGESASKFDGDFGPGVEHRMSLDSARRPNGFVAGLIDRWRYKG